MGDFDDGMRIQPGEATRAVVRERRVPGKRPASNAGKRKPSNKPEPGKDDRHQIDEYA